MSVVDYLKKVGKDSSYAYRKQLASQYGINDYKGTATQNTQLLRNLQTGSSNAVNPTVNSEKTKLGEAYSYENPNITQSTNSPLTIEARKQAVAQARGNVPDPSTTGYSNKPYFAKSKMTVDYQKKLKALEKNKPEDFSSKYTDQIDGILKSIQNPAAFDLSTNDTYKKLYDTMSESYMHQGQRAMRDTMGSLAGLSGGYANSYAGTVASQAYDEYLTRINDNNMQLAQMALDDYWRNRNDKYNQLGAVQSQDNVDYGRYRDTVNDYHIDRDYYAGRYDSSFSNDYNLYSSDLGQYNNDRDYEFNKSQAKLAQDNLNREFAYKKEQDALAQANYEKEWAYKLQQDALAAQMASLGASGRGGGGGGRGRGRGRGKGSSSKNTGSVAKGGYLPFTAELYRKMSNGEISERDAYYDLLDEVDKGNISQADFDAAMKSAGISNKSEEQILQGIANENSMNTFLALKYPELNMQMQSQNSSSKTKKKLSLDHVVPKVNLKNPLNNVLPKVNIQNKKKDYKGGQSGRIKLS